jgi:hypothetical protein
VLWDGEPVCIPSIFDGLPCVDCEAKDAELAWLRAELAALRGYLADVHLALGEAPESDDETLAESVTEHLTALRNRLRQTECERDEALAAMASDGADAVKDNAILRAEVEKLKAEHERRDRHTYCAYCGEEYELEDKETPAKVSVHIATCEKHPMFALRARLREAEAAMNAIDNEAQAYLAYRRKYPEGV